MGETAGDADAAVADINENQKLILGLLGKIYLQTKHTLEAQEIYERLAILDPNSADTNYNLGICKFHLRNYDKAEQLFKKEDYEEAILNYKKAISKLNVIGWEEDYLKLLEETIETINIRKLEKEKTKQV